MTLSYRGDSSGFTLESLIGLRVGCFTLLSAEESLKVSVRELASKRINKSISDYYPDTCGKILKKKEKKMGNQESGLRRESATSVDYTILTPDFGSSPKRLNKKRPSIVPGGLVGGPVGQPITWSQHNRNVRLKSQ